MFTCTLLVNELFNSLMLYLFLSFQSDVREFPVLPPGLGAPAPAGLRYAPPPARICHQPPPRKLWPGRGLGSRWEELG